MFALTSSHLGTFLLDILLKGVALLILGHLTNALLRRWGAPATLRRAVWGLAFAALVALPLGQAVLPQASLPDTIGEVGRAVERSAGEAEVRRPSSPREGPPSRPDGGREASAGNQVSTPAEASGATDAAAVRSSSASDEGRAGDGPGPSGWMWGPVLIGIWGAGAALLLVRLLAGLLRARRLRRTARKAEAPGWNVLLGEVREQLGSGRDVEIRFHGGSTPMALGLFAPTILLPDSAREWPSERRRLVLLHEMAHLQHRDLLLGVVGQLGRALHWPNPLAWTSWSVFERVRETACDEAVLAAGEDPQTYARQLLAAARRAVADNAPAPALEIARSTQLRERILSIIGRDGSGAWSSGRKVLLGTLVLALTLSVGALRPLPDAWYPRADWSGSGLVSATTSAQETTNEAAKPDETIQNLRAFAKLYGVVRYFHPSDAATGTDWDAFAVHGARQVADADGQAELRSTLDDLFAPIAPTIQLYETGEQPPALPDVLMPADTTELIPGAPLFSLNYNVLVT